MTTSDQMRHAAITRERLVTRKFPPGCPLDLLYLQQLANGNTQPEAAIHVGRSMKTMNDRMMVLRVHWGCKNTIALVAKALREGKIQ